MPTKSLFPSQVYEPFETNSIGVSSFDGVLRGPLGMLRRTRLFFSFCLSSFLPFSSPPTSIHSGLLVGDRTGNFRVSDGILAFFHTVQLVALHYLGGLVVGCPDALVYQIDLVVKGGGAREVESRWNQVLKVFKFAFISEKSSCLNGSWKKKSLKHLSI